ncbi:hypothetical protein LTR17_004487 [Elasticomyces elasticus]|nr:hypothetical protein LTR17_004487 [Elasticomyces elasticus]
MARSTPQAMSKLITVVGATGTQGGSVIRALLDSHDYNLRAITRNRNSEAAQSLAAKGIEIVEANLHDLSSLKAAFAGSYAIFGVTNYFDAFPGVPEAQATEVEAKMAINLANAAAATAGLKHYIWSTLPNTRKMTGGKVIVPHYEAKNRADDHIKSMPELHKKTTFLWIPWYGQNIFYPFYQPFAIPTLDPGTLYQFESTSPHVTWKVAGDVTVNVGLFVKAILAQPEKTLNGAAVVAASDDMTPQEIVSAWAAPQGKKGAVIQLNRQAYHDLWAPWTAVMDLSQQYFEMMGDKSFTGESVVLTKADLGVEGLVGTAEFFAKAQRQT